MRAKKTEKRLTIINTLMETLMSPEIFETIHYHRRNESYIKQFMYGPLLKAVRNIFKEVHGCSEKAASSKSRTALRWEGDKKTTVNNFVFFGTQHRPDFDIFFNDFKVAVEVKRGSSGSDVRSGIGQSLVYTTYYDFCIYLFIDTSKDKKILNASSSEREEVFSEALWVNNNIMFKVV